MLYSNSFKKVVFGTIILVAIASVAFTLEKVHSLTREISSPIGNQSLFVTGAYKIRAVPDIAFVSYSLRIESKDVKKSGDELDTRINKIKTRLLSEGISSENVYFARYTWNKFQEFNSQIELPSPANFGGSSFVSQDIIIEIEGTQEEINQKLSVLEKVALEYGLSPASNGNSHICLDFKDKNKIFDLGRKNAVLDAQMQAKSLVDVAGIDLGKIVNITDNNYGYGAVNSPYGNYCSTQLGSSKVIEEQEIPVSVGVTFEIK